MLCKFELSISQQPGELWGNVGLGCLVQLEFGLAGCQEFEACSRAGMGCSICGSVGFRWWMLLPVFPSETLLWKSHLGGIQAKQSRLHTTLTLASSAKRGRRAFCRINPSQGLFQHIKGKSGTKDPTVWCAQG